MENLSEDVIHGLSDSLTLVGLFGGKQSIIAETTSLNLRYFKLGSAIWEYLRPIGRCNSLTKMSYTAIS
jgi:hypothetical protein